MTRRRRGHLPEKFAIALTSACLVSCGNQAGTTGIDPVAANQDSQAQGANAAAARFSGGAKSPFILGGGGGLNSLGAAKQVLAPVAHGDPTPPRNAAVASSDRAMQLISGDSSANGGGNIIYATIGHLSPSGQQTSQLNVVRFGLTKVLNSISMNPYIVPLTPLDNGKTVYRINMDDYKQPNALSRIRTAPNAENNISQVGNATVVKGDWLVYALSRPEVYDIMMSLPQLGSMLVSTLGVNYNQAVYVNTNRSEVTFGGRVLMRAPIELGGKPGGYFWRSYDFARPDVMQRGFQNPQSLQSTSIPDLVAGEFFFSLPNGLQGYYLTGFGDQHRYDVPGPGGTSIDPPVATDYRRPQDGLSYCVGGKAPCGFVINGESCMTCHASGINAPTDPAGTNGATMAQITSLITADQSRFAGAVKEMGFIDVQEEPIMATIKIYRDTNSFADKRGQGSEVSGLLGR